MSDVFSFVAGDTPLLVSVPHDGRRVPEEQQRRMTAAGRQLPDTDWDVARLYSFAEDAGASMIVASYSRYVVDLNRPSTDAELYPGQLATGLCPVETFAGEAIYADGAAVDDAERRERVERYWRPYHDRIAATLDGLRERHGYALLWEAHSIPSRVPRLFDGELPVLNLGTYEHRSCDRRIADAVMRVATQSGYESVRDGRFKGGFITRHYGAPSRRVHAIQLELAQRAYMDEATRRFAGAKAAALRGTLSALLDTYLKTAADVHS